MAHVFIVNETTFKIHLEYLFAGTGAADVSTNFIFDTSIILKTQDEKRSVGMINDVSRIKQGDKIIFFVTGISKFYGVFEAASEFFLDPNDNNNYLVDKLGKVLTYRILLKPYRVYQNGLSEYDCLDSLKGVQYVDQMCWSLIYRKLEGNRGCTMITNQEYEIFEAKLKQNNVLISSGNFSYDDTNEIIYATSTPQQYAGRMISVNSKMESQMIERYSNKREIPFEHYLQYVTIIEAKNNPNSILLPNTLPVCWIGNEVMCSFGKHRIDELLIQESEKTVDFSLIELKDEKVYESIIIQLERYIIWMKDYIIPYYLRQNKEVNIHPIIVSDGIENSRQSTKDKLKLVEQNIVNFDWSKHNQTNINVYPAKIIHFNIENNKITLKKWR